MNYLRALICSVICMLCGELHAQNTLNIYLVNGNIDSLDITAIDSVNFVDTPPPLSLYFYLNDGTSVSYPYSDIDSIDFSFLGSSPTSIFNPVITYGTVQDADWNSYNTVQIGNQVWMAENLRTSKYSNGDPIPFISDTANWLFIDYGAYTYYLLDSSLIIPNGYLYNWHAVADARNVCPTGWHVPRKSEMEELITYLGGTVNALGKLKSTASDYWLPPNVSASNSSGFSAVGSGQINSLSFIAMFNDAFYWSSSLQYINIVENAYSIEISHDENYMEYHNSTNLRTGNSIRCIQGDEYFPFDFGGSVLNSAITYGTLEDVEGNRYRTVNFEGQEWMAENLRTSTFANGDPIPFIPLTEPLNWQNTTESAHTLLQWALKGYGVGKLYNQYAAKDPRNICPDGWRVPEVVDFDILFANLDGRVNAAKHLKSTDHWGGELPGTSDNSIGFSSIPGGMIDNMGNSDYNYYNRLWTATGNDLDQIIAPIHIEKDVNAAIVLPFTANMFYMNEGYSVRCIKENPIDYFPMDSILNNSLVYGSISDINGNEYKTITIGTQNWMAQNLRTSNFSNGDPIQLMESNSDWANASTPGSTSLYNNNMYDSLLGKMYNFYAVSDIRNVCPTNWHVPSDAEWQVLIDYLGGNEFAGAFLKSEGDQYWTPMDFNPFAPSNNSTGFSALPSPTRDGMGWFMNDGTYVSFWSSTDFGGGEGLVTFMDSASDWAETQGLGGYTNGYPIRCVED